MKMPDEIGRLKGMITMRIIMRMMLMMINNIIIILCSPSNVWKTSNVLTELETLRCNFVAQSVGERIVVVVAHFATGWN